MRLRLRAFAADVRNGAEAFWRGRANTGLEQREHGPARAVLVSPLECVPLSFPANTPIGRLRRFFSEELKDVRAGLDHLNECRSQSKAIVGTEARHQEAGFIECYGWLDLKEMGLCGGDGFD
jgi:hypothetical protein